MSRFSVTDRALVVDFVLAMAVGVVVLVPSRYDMGIALASLVLVSALFVRRIAPGIALAVGTVGALLLWFATSSPSLGIVVVPILVYSVARWSRYGRRALLIGVIGSLLGPARWASLDNGLGYGLSNLAYFGLMALAASAIVGTAYLFGSRRREARLTDEERQQSAAERDQLLQTGEQQRAQVAAINERNRIARELHDIVAHSLSVIVVQAEGGRALSAKKPEAAPAVFGTIAETSRQALAETRHIVGLLRGEGGGPDPSAYAPTPGLEELADLVGKTSPAFEFTVFGAAPAVPQALGLTAYRIVQESLTNVLKHAGPGAHARVTAAYTADAIELEITDNGAGAAARAVPAGHGQEGMRERVAVHGGLLSVGPRIGGGYTVRAWLPLSPTAVPPTGPRSQPSATTPHPAGPQFSAGVVPFPAAAQPRVPDTGPAHRGPQPVRPPAVPAPEPARVSDQPRATTPSVTPAGAAGLGSVSAAPEGAAPESAAPDKTAADETAGDRAIRDTAPDATAADETAEERAVRDTAPEETRLLGTRRVER